MGMIAAILISVTVGIFLGAIGVVVLTQDSVPYDRDANGEYIIDDDHKNRNL